MSDQIPVVEAFRVMAANKSLSDEELHDLIRDGIHAALARRFGGPVEAEIEICHAVGRFPPGPAGGERRSAAEEGNQCRAYRG